MRHRRARWIGLVLVLVTLLAGCLKPLATGSQVPAGPRQVAAVTAAVTPIKGQIESFSYNVQAATMADIAVASTVSLIDTSTNRTMGTTVSDAQGRFLISFTDSFQPTTNLYYLEAYKGLPKDGVPNRAGANMARVRTLIKYENGQWRHLYTEEGIRISVASTALSVISSLRSASDSTQIDPARLLGSLNAVSEFTSGTSGVTVGEFQTVRDMVSRALLNDDDPLYRITYDLVGRAYFLVDRGVSIARIEPLQGPMGTPVEVEGTNLGLTPVVRFNGTPATSTVNGTSTLITTTVPVGATSGPVTVQIGTVVYNGANFAVSPWDGHNVFDAAGNMYVSSSRDNRIYRFDRNGNPTLYVSGGLLNYPRGLVVDPQGNLYVANQNDHKILKIDTNRTVTVVAQGNGLSSPSGLALNVSGDLFVANYNGHNVLKIASGSATPTVLATGGFNYPWGVALDPGGNLYVSNWGSGVVTKVTSSGSTSTFASGLSTPAGVSLDSSGNVYVGCYSSHNIYKLSTSGSISIFASAPNYPGSVAMNPDGTLYMASNLYDYIARYDSIGRVMGYWSAGQLTWGIKAHPTTKDLYVTSGSGWGQYTKSVYRMPFNSGTNDYDPPRPVLTGLPSPTAIALYGSSGAYVGDWGGTIYSADLTTGNYAPYASLPGPVGEMALDSSSTLYATGLDYHALYKFGNGSITRRYGYSWYFNNAAFGPDGSLFVPDYWQGKVLRFSTSGVMSVFSDNGGAGFNAPHGIAVDATGNVFVASWSNNKIYRIPAGGGTATEYVSSGLSYPAGMVFDAAGNLYCTGWSDGTVKKVAASDRSVTNYATGLTNPRGLCLDPATGILYAACNNGTVYKIAPNGATGTVTTYATGVGPAMQAFFDGTTGDVLVAGYTNNAIYRIPPGGGTALVHLTLSTSVGGVVKDASGNLYALCWGLPYIYRYAPGSSTARLWGASLHRPAGLVLTPDDRFAYIADWTSQVVYKVDLTSGDLAIVANSVDWPGGANTLKGITRDDSGNLYVSSWNNGVYKLDPGQISNTNGLGVVRYGDSSAAAIQGGIAFGANGNLYGATWETVNSGYSPITFIPPGTVSGNGGSAANMTNWPRYMAF